MGVIAFYVLRDDIVKVAVNPVVSARECSPVVLAERFRVKTASPNLDLLRVELLRTAQSVIRGGRVDQRLGETPLVCNRQANDFGLGNRAICLPLRGIDNEVTNAAALEFRRAFHDSERVRCDALLQSGGPIGFLWHQDTPLRAICTSNLRTKARRKQRDILFWPFASSRATGRGAPAPPRVDPT